MRAQQNICHPSPALASTERGREGGREGRPPPVVSLVSRCGLRTRAVMIPGLESAPEYDRSMILKFVRSDSGSGSFQVDPLESAPVLESAPLVHCWSFLNQAEPVISYFDVPN